MALDVAWTFAPRRFAVLILLMAFVASVVSITAASAWSGYPFLVDGPPPVSQDLYMPRDAGVDVIPQSLELLGGGRAVEMRVTSSIRTGGSLKILESTSPEATARTVLGPIVDQDACAGPSPSGNARGPLTAATTCSTPASVRRS